MESPFMTSAEAAQYLRVSKKTLHHLVWRGQIPHRKHGHKTLFLISEIDAWSKNTGIQKQTTYERYRSLTTREAPSPTYGRSA